MGWGSLSSWFWASAAAAGKLLHLRNLAWALNTDGAGCTLTVGRVVETEIPVNSHSRPQNSA